MFIGSANPFPRGEGRERPQASDLGGTEMPGARYRSGGSGRAYTISGFNGWRIIPCESLVSKASVLSGFFGGEVPDGRHGPRFLDLLLQSDQLVELSHDSLGYVCEIVDPLLQGHWTPLVMIFPTSAQTFHKPAEGRSFLSPA